MTRIDARNGKIARLVGVSILLVLFRHFNIANRPRDTLLSHLFGVSYAESPG